MKISLSTPADAERVAAFYVRNQAHLEPWEPAREPGYHAIDAWRTRLEEREQLHAAKLGAFFLGCCPEHGDVMAICNLSAVVRGAFQACYMGFAVGACHEGQGHMRALAEHALAHAFGPLDLHRVMANHMPHNLRSAKLLAKLGFEREGLARQYLRIAGRWEDHVLTSLRTPSTQRT